MLLKNVSARLITLNVAGPKGGTFSLIPDSPAVEVPDELGSAKAFVDAAIASGELVEIAQDRKAKSKDA